MRSLMLCGLLLICGLAAAATPQATPSLAGFSDAIHHWQNEHGKGYPRYPESDFRHIADNLLLYQRADGGWVQNHDPARILDAAALAQLAAQAQEIGGSFDNRNIYTQIDYLAAAWALSGDARYADGSRRGLEFALAQQIANCGGWPHTVPAKERYHPHITFADDVMSGMLTTLRRVLDERQRYAFVDAALLARVQAAVARGDACLLRLQQRHGDTLTAWAGQYDETGLQPTQGRMFELPSIAVQESVGVLRYLMSIRDPSPQVIAAVDGAVAWLRRVEIHGWRLETVDAAPAQYAHHATQKDRRLVADPQANHLWARFYALDDDSPLLATREGVRVARYEDIPRERRTGYSWYGSWPAKLLEKDYPRWQAQLHKRDTASR